MSSEHRPNHVLHFSSSKQNLPALSTSFFFSVFLSFFLSFCFLFFFVNVVLISSGSVQVRPPCPEAKDVLNNIIGLVNAVTKLDASKGCGKAVGKTLFCFCMGPLPVTTHETLVTLHEPPVFVLFWFLFCFVLLLLLLLLSPVNQNLFC